MGCNRVTHTPRHVPTPTRAAALTASVGYVQLVVGSQFFGGELASTEDGLRLVRAVVGHEAT